RLRYSLMMSFWVVPWRDQIPLKRIGEPNDVAGCVLFLASDLSKYLTGVTLDVNGGMLIH
ncbi:MAG: SDR family oxidoreductase, partial [Burkholderiaceae bacterium]